MMKVLVQMNKYFGQNGCDDCLFKRINTIELVQMISLNSLTMYQMLSKQRFIHTDWIQVMTNNSNEFHF